MKNLQCIFIIILSYSVLWGSNIERPSKLWVDYNSSGEVIYYHTIKKGETIYSISRQTNSTVEKIFKLNGIQDVSNLSIGSILIIPVSSDKIYKGTPESIPSLQVRTPLYYKVKPKETLYTICKTYFDQDIEILKRRNKINNSDLSVGQELLIGWFLTPVAPDLQEPTNQETNPSKELLTQSEESRPLSNPSPVLSEGPDTISLYIKNKLFVDKVNELPPTRRVVNRKEVAIWDKEAPRTQKLFALHRDAPKNSVIEIYNPHLDRTAFVTVIGKIPEDSYTKDVTLIVSPEVAQTLGALDNRFLVEVKYYQ